MSSENEWETDIAQRLARVQPEHTIRGLALQSYLEQLRALGDEAPLARGLALCGNAPPVELFYYSESVQLQLLSLLMPSLMSRHGDAASALRAAGRQNVNRFLSSGPGRLLLKLTRCEPRRLLTHAPMGYRLMSNACEHAQSWSDIRRCLWRMRNEMMPGLFHVGIILELLEQGRARDPRVVCRQTSLLDCEFDVSWS